MEQMTLMAGRSAADQREQFAADMARIAAWTKAPVGAVLDEGEGEDDLEQARRA